MRGHELYTPKDGPARGCEGAQVPHHDKVKISLVEEDKCGLVIVYKETTLTGYIKVFFSPDAEFSLNFGA